MTVDIGLAGGWEKSADAWIAAMGTRGDFAREFILDPPLVERVRTGKYRQALDVGCGEGRFCRLLGAMGIQCVGLDPAPSLVNHAVALDPAGEYLVGSAEQLPFQAESFDLVVSYVSLLSIPDLEAGIFEMVRVLRPSGTLLIANLHSIVSAGLATGAEGDVGTRFLSGSYFERRAQRVTWGGIDVLNWHRPLEDYFGALLRTGLTLQWFAEPVPQGADSALASPFHRVPHFVAMEWRK